MSLIRQASDATKKSELFRWVKRGLTIGTVRSKVNKLLGVSAMLLVVSALASTGWARRSESRPNAAQKVGHLRA